MAPEIASLALEACPLCEAATSKVLFSRDGRKLFRCGRCRLVFAEESARLSDEECRRRYLLHENGIEHKGYCDFLSRAIDLAEPFLSRSWMGLDYGCGPGPALSKLLRARGYSSADYDPLFFDGPLSTYDFIFSTECFEHFSEPKREISKIVRHLRPGGVLTIMTDLWGEGTDFKTWHYATDPTHVSFYAEQTLAYVARTFGLAPLASDGKRVFVFLKNGCSQEGPA